MMKRLFMAVAAILVISASLFADNAGILSKIESANASVTSLDAHFAQKRILRASGKVIKSEGTIDYVCPSKLSLKYDEPSKDRLIINGDKFYNVKNGQASNFDTSKNQLVAALSNTLLYCIQGKVQKVADENNADVAIAEANGNYVVTLTAKKQTTKGYTKIVLTYRKSDCILIVMEMEEVGGINTTYTMSSIQKGGKIDAAVFDIPKK